jgi:hypothetical protein
VRHSTRKPGLDDVARFVALRQLGCLACHILWVDAQIFFGPKARRPECGAVEIHHQLSGNRRIGHDATVPLGRWHHQGIQLPGLTVRQMDNLYGPSLARSSKRFRERFGEDIVLLELANSLLASKTRRKK